MIEAKRLIKRYGLHKALDNVTFSVPDGSIYGLIGSNGAGKSTLLGILSGVLRQDRGSLSIDGEKVYEHPQVKEKCFTITDDPFYFGGSTPREMAEYYRGIYGRFDSERYKVLMKDFGLDEKQRLRTMSKGMRRQSSIICGVSSGAQYLFCDEAFDGLDPAARNAAKRLLIADAAERNSTVIISSHNLVELEQFCDNIGLLHQGRLLLSSELDAAKTTLQKVQYVCDAVEQEPDLLFRELPLLRQEKRGRLRTVILRSEADPVRAKIMQSGTVFYEILPLTLEEIFLVEMEVNGYDPQKFGL